MRYNISHLENGGQAEQFGKQVYEEYFPKPNQSIMALQDFKPEMVVLGQEARMWFEVPSVFVYGKQAGMLIMKQHDADDTLVMQKQSLLDLKKAIENALDYIEKSETRSSLSSEYQLNMRRWEARRDNAGAECKKAYFEEREWEIEVPETTITFRPSKPNDDIPF